MPDTIAHTQTRRTAGAAEDTNSLPLITIYEISKLLSATLNLERSLYDVLNILASYLQMRRGVITLVGEHDQLDVVAVAGMSLRSVTSGPAAYPLDAARQVMSTAMPMVVHNMAEDPLFRNYSSTLDSLDGERQSLVGVPIKTVGKPFGTLSVERHLDGTNRFMFERDVRYLTMVANLIGQAMSLERQVAADRDRLILEKARLEKAIPRADIPLRGQILDNVIGHSDAMMRVSAQVRQIAPSRATVLLRGESGTGKELIAKAIHYLSPRADKPFIKVNCAALTESLLESELFGHEKGAFTGANAERKGRFELASGGTLFLDEIGEISTTFQAKLLRVLQEGEFERVGGNKTLKADVRMVAATNRDLEDAVMSGDFRADLYYRINVVPVFLPPLRERKEDVPLLAQFFLDKFNEENGRGLQFSAKALDVMQCCAFPGNVRELENCVFRAATLSHGDVIEDMGLSCMNNQCLSSTLWNRKTEGRPIGGLGVPVTEECTPDTAGQGWDRPQGPGAGYGGAAAGYAPSMPPPTHGYQPTGPVHSPPQGGHGQGAPGYGGPAPAGPTGMPGYGDAVPTAAHPVAPMPGAAPSAGYTPGVDPGVMVGGGSAPMADGSGDIGVFDPNDSAMDQREKLVMAMEKAGWVQAKAARLLGMTPRQIGYALKKYDIEVKRI